MYPLQYEVVLLQKRFSIDLVYSLVIYDDFKIIFVREGIHPPPV